MPPIVPIRHARPNIAEPPAAHSIGPPVIARPGERGPVVREAAATLDA
jgi:hypothetical protein